MDGKFITLEGIDGSGKTTILNKIIETLEKNGYADQLVVTREPGGDKISENIRNIILDNEYTEMDPRTEALLYAASRRQHLIDIILPALKAGKIVICDRFVDSSIAYQGVGRKIGIQGIKDINNFATDYLQPDMTLYFDVTPEISKQRVALRERKKDRLDQENDDFYAKVYDGYADLVKENPQRIKVIDATQSVDEVFKETMAELNEFLVRE